MENLLIEKNLNKKLIFKRPLFVGSFGIEKDEKFENVYHSNSYPFYKILNLEKFSKTQCLDLKEGFNSTFKLNELNENKFRNELLKWILENSKKFSLNKHLDLSPVNLINLEFVSNRRTLSLIMLFNFDNSSITIIAQKLKGVIFLFHKQKKINYKKEILFTYCGYKFEDYLTKNLIPNNSKKLNSNEFFGVYNTNINDHSILYSAEIDCFEEDIYKECLKEEVDASRLKSVELKTTNFKRNLNHTLRYKSLKWWTQSVLVNNSKIIVGIRNKNFMVKDLVQFRLNDLISIGSINKNWKPNDCIQSLDQFLTYIKCSFTKTNNNVLTFTKIKNIIQCKPDTCDFLPNFFVDNFN